MAWAGAAVVVAWLSRVLSLEASASSGTFIIVLLAILRITLIINVKVNDS